MKILVLAPFGAIEPNAENNLRARARPGTHVDVECLEDVFPLPYNTYQYNMTKVIDGTVERALRAEAEGYDALVISCMLDPGLIQARGVVDIPVVGTLEATAHVASMMGNRFSLINADATVCAQMERLLTFYGLKDKVASLRHIDIVSCDLYPEKTPTEEVFRRVKEQAQRAIREDGAEVIIAGCTIIGSLLTQHHGEHPEGFLQGVPVLDGVTVGFKTAELMVDLVQLGYPAVSRLGFWKKPPAEETQELRQWFTQHDSPFHHNWERMPDK
jgi:Asp/Glu/hydantoin racemase